jgi:hypothetical protein
MNSSPTINLYISPRDIQLVSDGHPVQARSSRQDRMGNDLTHVVQVSFPLESYEVVPSVVNLGLFTVARR